MGNGRKGERDGNLVLIQDKEMEKEMRWGYEGASAETGRDELRSTD